jgi:hypothetical protein
MGTVTPLGAVNVAAAGIFNVQDNVTSGAALASNAGTINISAGKALTVTSVTGAPTGTFGFQLNRTAGFDTNGQLVINPGGGNVDFHLATIPVPSRCWAAMCSIWKRGRLRSPRCQPTRLRTRSCSTMSCLTLVRALLT